MDLKLVTTFLLISLSSFTVSAEDFPYRKEYSDTPPISTDHLKAGFDKKRVLIFDVRSNIEFEVIHLEGAINIPLSHTGFEKEVQKVIDQNPGKKYAFYCNGITCLKSYKAARKMVKAGCETCFVYDAGIPDWASKFPRDTVLLGQKLTDSGMKFITKPEFKEKCLNYEEFKTKANKTDAMLIDTRDFIQASKRVPDLETAKKYPFSNLIPLVIKKKRHQDKTLYIFDQVGKQVRWLMYYLEKYGYTKYYFLSNGATGVLKEQKYRGKI